MRIIDDYPPSRSQPLRSVKPVDHWHRKCVPSVDQHEIEFVPVERWQHRFGFFGYERYLRKIDVVRCTPISNEHVLMSVRRDNCMPRPLQRKNDRAISRTSLQCDVCRLQNVVKPPQSTGPKRPIILPRSTVEPGL